MPMPVMASGFEMTSGGPAARPSITLGAGNLLISGLIIEAKDLVGCEVTRWRTFRRFLDDGYDPDPDSHFPLEIYRIERKKAARYGYFVEFELASILDQEGIKLPKRQILKDYCNFFYRWWDAETFQWQVDKYDPCPYMGGACYDKDGKAVTDPALDRCGKKLRDCQLRYPYGLEVPFRGFPGVGRL